MAIAVDHHEVRRLYLNVKSLFTHFHTCMLSRGSQVLVRTWLNQSTRNVMKKQQMDGFSWVSSCDALNAAASSPSSIWPFLLTFFAPYSASLHVFIMLGVCLEEPFDLLGDLFLSLTRWLCVKVGSQCKDPDHRPISDCLTNKQQWGENLQSQSQLLLGSCHTWSPVEACASLGRGQKMYVLLRQQC